VDAFYSTPSHVMRALLKWEVNHGSLSLIIFVGSLNHLKMWSCYSCVIPGPIIVVLHGKNMAMREHPWSTIVSIVSFPFTGGSPVIKSIAIL
jgi:hypothetical protein